RVARRTSSATTPNAAPRSSRPKRLSSLKTETWARIDRASISPRLDRGRKDRLRRVRGTLNGDVCERGHTRASRVSTTTEGRVVRAYIPGDRSINTGSLLD